MIIRTAAYARAGLIGNPSDGYFGKTISLIVRDFAARVTCFETPRIAIHARRRDQLEFDSIADLADDVRLNGYYGGIRLIKATVKRFHDYCVQRGIELDGRCFTLEYESDIPIRVGLAGSSAIVTATMRALMTFYGIEIAKPIQPNLILSVELDELGIGAGLQDRVIQVYEGVVFMDFDKQKMETQGHGDYQPLPPQNLPPLFVAYDTHLAEGTEVTHNDLRVRFNRGDQEVHDAVVQWAALAQQARDLIFAGKGDEIGPLLDANYDLRARICKLNPHHKKLVEIGRRHGVHAKYSGSGGAVIAAYDGDPQRLARLTADYQAIGAKVITPTIV
jgi:glucuronokinase